ncbi:hypothetical protein G4N59_002353 [Staphylococcus pseudintermedius]|nr:hypothetical protein [Staphylococcus pseudintermedius]EGQ3318843.1 hypothetical protein [Staphylococcus pseudintermedius]EGQ3758610.1 hypothetical protein [Staphylococcus pseudintermedius]EGQ3762913.1 hypothetical protein [Staphylococcus pseudintermedius]
MIFKEASYISQSEILVLLMGGKSEYHQLHKTSKPISHMSIILTYEIYNDMR